jgi:hypothetical protein
MSISQSQQANVLLGMAIEKKFSRLKNDLKRDRLAIVLSHKLSKLDKSLESNPALRTSRLLLTIPNLLLYNRRLRFQRAMECHR